MAWVNRKEKEKAFEDILNCVSLYKKYGGELVLLFHTIAIAYLVEEYRKTLELVFD